MIATGNTTTSCICQTALSLTLQCAVQFGGVAHSRSCSIRKFKTPLTMLLHILRLAKHFPDYGYRLTPSGSIIQHATLIRIINSINSVSHRKWGSLFPKHLSQTIPIELLNLSNATNLKVPSIRHSLAHKKHGARHDCSRKTSWP